MSERVSRVQRRANDKWKAEHAERSRYINQRSQACSFIRHRATLNDLDELQQLIDEMREKL
ncbi:hypothetical protein [Lacticaseibacillus jixiensis]|uniref:hypothetical protein n=1 Tax=Lacticaseibacillus jixiensis TaxID=3231926 RepID=UPI0036F2CF67